MNRRTPTSLRVSRIIRAPRAKVYAAFIDVDGPQARRFAPDARPGSPMRSIVHEHDLRPGGRIRATLVADEGRPTEATYAHEGVFLEVVPNERIVRTFRWAGDEDAPETRVTFTFRDVPGGTEVTILHEGLPGRDSVEGHLEGWTEALANFAAALEPWNRNGG